MQPFACTKAKRPRSAGNPWRATHVYLELLQETVRFLRRSLALLWLLGPLLSGGEPALQPLTVCEIMKDLAAYDGKVVAVVGRFSFRQSGRWLGEQHCAQKLVIADQEWANAFWVRYDPVSAPAPPAVLAVDGVLLAQKLREAKRNTALTKFRFGSQDYDAWAVIYGRVETRKDMVLVSADGTRKNGFGYGESSPAQLVCHSEAVVVFLNEDATTPASR